jgi:anti-sigma B factor antagonist
MSRSPYRAPRPDSQSAGRPAPRLAGRAAPQWQQITRGTKTLLITWVTDTGDAIVAAGAHDGQTGAVLFQASHEVRPAGEIVVRIAGELDIATADLAAAYVRDIVSRAGGPVIADVSGVRFCDVLGLGALARMARYAEQAGCPFRLASPRPSLAKLIRIAGLSHRFPPASGQDRSPPGVTRPLS